MWRGVEGPLRLKTVITRSEATNMLTTNMLADHEHGENGAYRRQGGATVQRQFKGLCGSTLRHHWRLKYGDWRQKQDWMECSVEVERSHRKREEKCRDLVSNLRGDSFADPCKSLHVDLLQTLLLSQCRSCFSLMCTSQAFWWSSQLDTHQQKQFTMFQFQVNVFKFEPTECSGRVSKLG